MLGVEIEFFRFRITKAKKLICFNGKGGDTNCYIQHHTCTGFKAMYISIYVSVRCPGSSEVMF